VWVREEEPMEVDLDELESWLHHNVYERFDHQYLNTLLPSNGGEAGRVTSEDIARLIAEQLGEKYPGKVLRVEVCETRDLCVEYVLSG
jgi:6-pyruvoyltetrahydropterin/6-carboxytetrahydropterin synthase